MPQVVFRATVSSMGRDRYGSPKYAIYVPKAVHDKVRGLVGKEVVVIVILPDDA